MNAKNPRFFGELKSNDLAVLVSRIISYDYAVLDLGSASGEWSIRQILEKRPSEKSIYVAVEVNPYLIGTGMDLAVNSLEGDDLDRIIYWMHKAQKLVYPLLKNRFDEIDLNYPWRPWTDGNINLPEEWSLLDFIVTDKRCGEYFSFLLKPKGKLVVRLHPNNIQFNFKETIEKNITSSGFFRTVTHKDLTDHLDSEKGWHYQEQQYGTPTIEMTFSN